MYLTRRQLEILDYIRQFRQNNGISPTLDEIAESFTVSKVTVFEHIEALQRKGILRKTRNHARSIELIDEDAGSSRAPSVRVLGTVAAGRPIEAIEIPDTFELGDLLPRRNECFLLRVEGNSMIDEQIRDGDYVVVEKRSIPRNGETVVAVIDGNEATLKKFYREKGRIRLQPANPELEPIYTRDVDVKGVVVGVIRKY
jgi:repressor LexA